MFVLHLTSVGLGIQRKALLQLFLGDVMPWCVGLRVHAKFSSPH